ncbi:MAG: DUF3141 domain-containing protein [Proteobacteria bacterium]|nr:DUF3141 domain-containing protein [Pseudomonadota bacterium]HMV38277.1 DUF3141 domain-containing protein [Plasticicumulans sp.]HND97305.1 DUF3141 domain-containing protein [Plasticicumulans sp.]
MSQTNPNLGQPAPAGLPERLQALADRWSDWQDELGGVLGHDLQRVVAAAAARQSRRCDQAARLATAAWQPGQTAGVLHYAVDSLQRTLLFWDTLRERGNDFIELYRAGNPPLLAFDYETLIDGRNFDEQPVNYALVRILPPAGVTIDARKRPYLIVDPRAGHGAGIGGFKPESQVGVALRAGHPVYFVIFFRDPVPGQRLRDVAAAEARFLAEVVRRHPDSDKPCVIGNCQGGWAVMGMVAAHPDAAGPLVINGAPMSYWAGTTGHNPMRYSGGMLGGSWLAQLTSDLAAGSFDGAWLVQNFENLDPAHNYWQKFYKLYAEVDTEASRFRDFEKWWGGYVTLTGSEIRAIVDNLFIGNRLAAGEIPLDRGETLDLRRIRSPIVVFCSEGDNITPPQQALNWILDVYRDDATLRAFGQTIVYLRHLKVGHLGVFVSGSVARKEYTEIVGTLDAIERLPPGLYEMLIDEDGRTPSGDPRYRVELAQRSMSDIVALDTDSRREEDYFRVVAALSELNAKAYDLLASPVLQALAVPESVELQKMMHPLRAGHWAFSDWNPWLTALGPWVSWARSMRAPVEAGHPLRQLEQLWVDGIGDLFDLYRDTRDMSVELTFYGLYGFLNVLGIPKPGERERSATSDAERVQREIAAWVDGHIASGGYLEGYARMALLLFHAQGGIGRDGFVQVLERLDAMPEVAALDREARRRIVREQSLIIAHAPERALATLAELLVTPGERERALAALDALFAGEALSDAAAALRKLLRSTFDSGTSGPVRSGSPGRSRKSSPAA